MADIELWRRHRPQCPKKSRGRKEKRCKCPIWCDGYINGKRIRESMGTRDWDRAEYQLARKFSVETGIHKDHRYALDDAIELYLKDCALVRGLTASTIASYRNTLDAFRNYCGGEHIFDVGQIGVDTITGFRLSRQGKTEKEHAPGCPSIQKRAGRRNCDCPVVVGKPKPSTHRKELETLRGFLDFCLRHKWVDENSAKVVKPPKDSHLKTLPFRPDEFRQIVDACETVFIRDRDKQRARALVWLLVYSGFRISDAAMFRRNSLNLETRRFVVRVKKNGEIVRFVLGQPACDALMALDVESEDYFLWSGESTLETCVKSLRRTLDAIRRATGVNVHPHRFRDTFAVRLLEKGVAIRTVQRLLGHQSVVTTEKYYAHWVHAHQALLDDAANTLDFESFGSVPDDADENTFRNSQGHIIPFPGTRTAR